MVRSLSFLNTLPSLPFKFTPRLIPSPFCQTSFIYLPHPPPLLPFLFLLSSFRPSLPFIFLHFSATTLVPFVLSLPPPSSSPPPFLLLLRVRMEQQSCTGRKMTILLLYWKRLIWWSCPRKREVSPSMRYISHEGWQDSKSSVSVDHSIATCSCDAHMTKITCFIIITSAEPALWLRI